MTIFATACLVLLATSASSNKCSIHVVVTAITFLLIFCHVSFLPVCRSSYSGFTTQIFDMTQDMSSATALPKMTSPERCRATSSAPEVECSSTREQSRALPCSLRVRITPATHVQTKSMSESLKVGELGSSHRAQLGFGPIVPKIPCPIIGTCRNVDFI